MRPQGWGPPALARIAAALSLALSTSHATAAPLHLTGRWVAADEAASLGIATAVVPRAEVDEAAADLAAAILAAPRNAVVETKALLTDAGRRTYDGQRSAERAAQARRLRDIAGDQANQPRA